MVKKIETEAQNKAPEKLSVEKLIARRANIKIENKVEYFSKELNGIIEVVKPPKPQFLDIVGRVDDNTPTDEAFEIQSELIYNCVPMFQNPELQAAYEVKDPLDIVLAVLNDNLNEFQEIAAIIFKFYKLDVEKLVALKKQYKQMKS